METNKHTNEKELARTVAGLVDKIRFDAIICLTETGKIINDLEEIEQNKRIIAATANSDTYNALSRSDLELIRMPIHGIDKYRQIPHLLSIALKTGRISVGDFVLVCIGKEVYPKEGDLIVLAEAERELEELSIKDLLKLTDGIRPAVLDSAIDVARKLGLVARRRKRIGTIFTLGD